LHPLDGAQAANPQGRLEKICGDADLGALAALLYNREIACD
jgi:hypothetical protein